MNNLLETDNGTQEAGFCPSGKKKEKNPRQPMTVHNIIVRNVFSPDALLVLFQNRLCYVWLKEKKKIRLGSVAHACDPNSIA